MHFRIASAICCPVYEYFILIYTVTFVSSFGTRQHFRLPLVFFSYVNFKSADSVESALSLAGTDCSGRKVRVQRCVKKAKVAVRDARGQRRTVTKKRQKDFDRNSYQGQKTGVAEGNKKWKSKKPIGKGERSKRKISHQLAGDSNAKKRKIQ